jgi:hypothetical protein
MMKDAGISFVYNPSHRSTVDSWATMMAFITWIGLIGSNNLKISTHSVKKSNDDITE